MKNSTQLLPPIFLNEVREAQNPYEEESPNKRRNPTLHQRKLTSLNKVFTGLNYITSAPYNHHASLTDSGGSGGETDDYSRNFSSNSSLIKLMPVAFR